MSESIRYERYEPEAPHDRFSMASAMGAYVTNMMGGNTNGFASKPETINRTPTPKDVISPASPNNVSTSAVEDPTSTAYALGAYIASCMRAGNGNKCPNDPTSPIGRDSQQSFSSTEKRDAKNLKPETTATFDVPDANKLTIVIPSSVTLPEPPYPMTSVETSSPVAHPDALVDVPHPPIGNGIPVGIVEPAEQGTPFDGPILPKKRDRKACGCSCLPSCNCHCSCSEKDHCACRTPCEGTCRTNPHGRNLVISIDGTSNTFCTTNTNVVELHSRIERYAGGKGDAQKPDKKPDQLKCYLSGIGTTLPPSPWMLSHWRIRFANALDLAIAWRFSKIVQDAYRWLMENYRPGDRIFLFGFSRGAYQVRTLAGMLHRLGLLQAGNRTLIPFAYDLYVSKYHELRANNPEALDLVNHFRDTFSIKHHVQVHFVGVWDTVSSIGIMRQMPLPLTNATGHMCYFRHALALDECRVKFIPEYLDEDDALLDEGGIGASRPTAQGNRWGQTVTGKEDVRSASGSGAGLVFRRPRAKEVWFAGSHSDIGGGYKENVKLNNSGIPLLWMENEARAAGLTFRARNSGNMWNPAEIAELPTTSMTFWWQILEYLPITGWRSFHRSETDFDWQKVLKSWKHLVLPFGTMTMMLGEYSIVHRVISCVPTVQVERFPNWIKTSISYIHYVLVLLGICLSFSFSVFSLIVKFISHTILSISSIGPQEGTTMLPHRGKGRVILESQFIHASVAFKPKHYRPKAYFGEEMEWDDLVGTVAVKDGQWEGLAWPQDLEHRLEKDLFDEFSVNDAIEEFLQKPQQAVLRQLSFMALAVTGADIMATHKEFLEQLISVISEGPLPPPEVPKEGELASAEPEAGAEQLTLQSPSVDVKDPEAEGAAEVSYISHVDCLCRIVKHTRQLGSAMKALPPLLKHIKLSVSDDNSTAEGPNIKRLQSFANTLHQFLKKASSSWVEAVTQPEAVAEVVILLFNFASRQMPVKIVDQSPGAESAIVAKVKSQIPSWLRGYNPWSSARKVEGDDCDEKVTLKYQSDFADIINTAVDCLSSTIELGRPLCNNIIEKMESENLYRLTNLLLDIQTQATAAKALSALALHPDGPTKITAARAIDPLITLIQIHEIDAFNASLQCLERCKGDDTTKEKILKQVLPTLIGIVRYQSNKLKPDFQFWATYWIRCLLYSDAQALLEENDFQGMLYRILRDENRNEALRLVCADTLAYILGGGGGWIPTVDLSLLEGLLEMLNYDPTRDHSRSLVKALEEVDAKTSDLAVGFGSAKVIDRTALALCVIEAAGGWAGIMTVLTLENLLEALTALLKNKEHYLLEGVDRLLTRLMNNEALRERILFEGQGERYVQTIVSLFRDPKHFTSFWAIRLASRFTFSYSSSRPPPSTDPEVSAETAREKEKTTFVSIVGKLGVIQQLVEITCDMNVHMGVRISASMTLADALANETIVEQLEAAKYNIMGKLVTLTKYPQPKFDATKVLFECSARDPFFNYLADPVGVPMVLCIDPLLLFTGGDSKKFSSLLNESCIDAVCAILTNGELTPYTRGWASQIALNIINMIRHVAPNFTSIHKLRPALQRATELNEQAYTQSDLYYPHPRIALEEIHSFLNPPSPVASVGWGTSIPSPVAPHLGSPLSPVREQVAESIQDQDQDQEQEQEQEPVVILPADSMQERTPPTAVIPHAEDPRLWYW